MIINAGADDMSMNVDLEEALLACMMMSSQLHVIINAGDMSMIVDW